MSYEDLIAIKAFVMALENLEQPLPEDLQTDLDVIAAALPESAYELHDLAERYEPLNQEYLAVLKNFPDEGERLKFVPAEVKLANGHESDAELNEVEVLLQHLRHQVTQASVKLAETQLASHKKHFIRDLGWTEEQVAQARYAFASFQEDWDDPAMDVYDDL